MKKFFYRVQSGDTILSVAHAFGAPVNPLIKTNNLTREIREGDVLYIGDYNGTVYNVQPFDTVESVAEKFGVSQDLLARANDLDYLFYGLTVIIPR